MLLRIAIVGSLAALSSLGCSSSVPKPPSGPIPNEAYVEIPYEPPAARVEIVPKDPGDGSVWVDGNWDWVGGKWRWLTGGWVKPIANAYYTPWRAVRRADGTLYFARATWRDARTKKPLGPPEPVAKAQPVGGNPVAAKEVANK